MKIFRAVKRNFISQLFGENKYDIYKVWGMLGHNGIDWSLEMGDPVYYDVDIRGTVITTEVDSNGGIGIDIITEGDIIYKHRYWHLKEVLVKAGDIVETGDIIAYGDNTGWSTGSHLHRGLKPQKIDSYGNYTNLYPENGYTGAIDYLPFLENIFVLDKMEQLKKLKYSLLERIFLILKQIIEIMLKGQK